MTRLMYDAVDPDNVPPDSELVMGYVDGPESEWPADAWSRFPGRTMVRCAVFSSTDDGTVGDLENGDMDEHTAVDWVVRRRAAGVDPTIYVDSARWPTAQLVFADRGVAAPHWLIAQWDGVAEIPPGAVGKQFQSSPGFDRSVVADYWPGVDPITPPPVTPGGLRELLLTGTTWH